MSRRTGLVLLITELHVGGAERALTNLALGLDPSEFEVTVVSLDSRPPPGQDELVLQLEQAGIAVEFLNPPWVWAEFYLPLRLRAFLRLVRPEVVLSFLYHANVLAGVTIASLRERPVHLAAVRVADPRRWRLRLEGYLLRRAAKVTCVSRMLADYVSKHQSVPRERIAVIPNGVVVDRFASAEPADLRPLGIGPERRLLTAIGRLDRQKGLDWLLSGVDPLLERLPGHDLLIVGEGPLWADLEQQVAASRYKNRIHLPGRRTDIPEILRRSELLLLPSRYEGMPNVVLEAMAAGLPVVVRPVEGVDELIGPHAGRQIAPFGDVSAYCNAVYELASESQTRQQLGSANQQRIAEHFSLQKMIDAYRELLREALSVAEKK